MNLYLNKTFLAILVFGCVSLNLQLSANEVFGMVLFREGETLVTRGILEFDAQVEEILFYEDEIETGENGSLQISFDASFMTIGPNSICTIEKELIDGEEVIKVILDQGSLRSKILNLGSRQFFEVESDSGKLRVHGTDFVAAVDPESPNQNFDVSVIQGVVAVEGTASSEDKSESDGGSEGAGDQSILLTQSQSSSVGKDGESAGVSELSQNDVGDLKEQLPIPGDDEAGLALDDLGIENQDPLEIVDQVVADVQEVKGPEDEKSPENDIPQEIVDVLEGNTSFVNTVGDLQTQL